MNVRRALFAAALVAATLAPSAASAQKDGFIDALIAFRTALGGTYGDEGPQLGTALHDMASSLAAWDEKDAATEAELRGGLPGAPSEDRLRRRIALASLMLDRGRWADALADLDAAVATDPQRALVYLARGLVRDTAGDVAGAVSDFQHAWELDRGDAVKAYLLVTRGLAPEDPFNQMRRPVPSRVKINTGLSSIDNRVGYTGFYAQDQWTLNRLTLSGALRYDHAFSSYPGSCIGGANEPYVPAQVGGAYAGQKQYCTPDRDGVSYHDITPRWGVTWDVFGTGRTAVKWNMGKYLAGAGVTGIYADANPAARTVNTYFRTWTDLDGDRRVDCNLLDFRAQDLSGSGGDICGGPTSVPGQDSVRYGRDPLSLDASGVPIGLGTTQCGRKEEGIPAAVQAYCNAYGDTLLDGWGKRRSEWQFGLGIQHEILPRLSAEVTYNRRSFQNLTVNDQLGIGCDRFGGAQTLEACNDAYLNYSSPSYGFFSVTAPRHPDLPGGGGYVVRGLANPNAALPVGAPTVVTIMDTMKYQWNGVETNMTWRTRGGFRINGGTSTGRSVRDLCHAETDNPNVRSYAGVTPQCNPKRRWDTNVRGSAAYTIPKIDTLVSSVFQWRPGVPRDANYTFTKDQVTWEPGNAARATAPCPAGATAGQVGCFTPGAPGSGVTATTYTVNLVNTGELYGEGYAIFDVKIGKNVRFGNKRANIGVDIYNVFNNDAIRNYNNTVDAIDNPATPVVEQFGRATELLSPRFVCLSIQFDF